jgi:uncharacterized protein involved in exopolysaccharide biosynthesis
MENDFIPSELIVKAAKKWWVFAVLMIVGGLAGILITRLNKPVYQSQAVITTAINYAYTGRLEDYELDHLILAVGDIIDSTSVRQQVIDQAIKITPDISPDSLDKNLTAIRKGTDWILSVSSTDADLSKKIAELWAAEAMKSLDEMNQKAVEDFHLQTAMLSLENCFSELVTIDPTSPGCTSSEIETFQTYLAGDSESAKTMHDNIILSNLSFKVTKEPQLPSSPILFRQSLNVAAGAIIGLCLGLGWFFRGGKQSK